MENKNLESIEWAIKVMAGAIQVNEEAMKAKQILIQVARANIERLKAEIHWNKNKG